MPVAVGNICTNDKCRWAEDSDYDVQVCPQCGSPTVVAYRIGYEDN